MAEPVFIASKLTHTRPRGTSDLSADEFKAWTRNVWTIPSGNVERDLDHPCKFPPELPRRLMKLYSYVGDVVLDPFCGSGTTLIAAETVKRICFAVELSPVYVDVAVRRWQAFTGEKAALLADGRLFDVVAAEPSRASGT